MQYEKYDKLIIVGRGVKLINWPEDIAFTNLSEISSFPALQKLHTALAADNFEKRCRWVKLGEEEWAEYKKQMMEKLLTNPLPTRKRPSLENLEPAKDVIPASDTHSVPLNTPPAKKRRRNHPKKNNPLEIMPSKNSTESESVDADESASLTSHGLKDITNVNSRIGVQPPSNNLGIDHASMPLEPMTASVMALMNSQSTTSLPVQLIAPSSTPADCQSSATFPATNTPAIYLNSMMSGLVTSRPDFPRITPSNYCPSSAANNTPSGPMFQDSNIDPSLQ